MVLALVKSERRRGKKRKARDGKPPGQDSKTCNHARGGGRCRQYHAIEVLDTMQQVCPYQCCPSLSSSKESVPCVLGLQVSPVQVSN